MPLPVLYQDNDVVVVNKPSGLLTHRSSIDRFAKEFAVQTIREQTNKMVYPVHRLDRATSGALIFAFSSDAARALSRAFANHEVEKKYLAVVRGIPQMEITLDYPLKEELDAKSDSMARQDKAAQPAVTGFTTLGSYEFQVKVDKFPTSRYSLVRARPKNGRKHQIRRHLRHLGHPIVGDITYGCGKHNRFFRTAMGSHRLLLACTEISFPHPATNQFVKVHAPLSEDFRSVAEALGWENHLG